jgi:hypothetical protein
MTPEVIDGMSNAEYHASPALGSTSLKTLATKTPAHYKHDQENPRHSDAFDLGTVVHSLVLEQDESGVVVVDADTWRTKTAKEQQDAARAEGNIALLTADWEQAKAMRDAIMGHPVAGPLFDGHIAEQSIFWEEDGLKLKVRPDAQNHGLIIDLKTTRDANPNTFGKIATDFGYHQSAALYQEGVELVTGERRPFLFVLAEKTLPHLVSVVELDEDALEYGRLLNDRAKRIYRECVASGNWPGYPKTEPISLPMWAIYQMDDLLGINTEMDIVI